MDKLIGVLQMILPVILMPAIGMICRKKGIVQKQGVAGLKSLVVNVCLPAVLLKAFFTAAYGLGIVITAAAMFAVCLAALGLGFVFKKLFRTGMTTVPFLFTGFEAGMLGYALYTLLFGTDAVTDFATVDLGQVLFVFTVYLSILSGQKQGSVKQILKGMASSPVIIAIAAGVILGASGLGGLISASPAGVIVLNIFDFIAAPTAAVILFVVGYELEFGKAKLKLAVSVVLTRLLMMAALGALVLLGLSAVIAVSDTLKWAVILMFMLPPPFVLPIFGRNEDESAFVSASLSLSTLLSLSAFAVIAVLSV
jgi:predicted permease